MSTAASGLLRALLARADVPRDRILLIDWDSQDWQSLTFTGERHVIVLRIVGVDAECATRRLIHDLKDAEFEIPGHIVADIALTHPPRRSLDGSFEVELEALTIAE